MNLPISALGSYQKLWLFQMSRYNLPRQTTNLELRDQSMSWSHHPGPGLQTRGTDWGAFHSNGAGDTLKDVGRQHPLPPPRLRDTLVSGRYFRSCASPFTHRHTRAHVPVDNSAIAHLLPSPAAEPVQRELARRKAERAVAPAITTTLPLSQSPTYLTCPQLSSPGFSPRRHTINFLVPMLQTLQQP